MVGKYDRRLLAPAVAPNLDVVGVNHRNMDGAQNNVQSLCAHVIRFQSLSIISMVIVTIRSENRKTENWRVYLLDCVHSRGSRTLSSRI